MSSSTNPTYVICPKCGADRFLTSRRMYTLDLEGGGKQRNWASGENSSDEIVCANDQTRLRWHPESQQYLVFTQP